MNCINTWQTYWVLYLIYFILPFLEGAQSGVYGLPPTVSLQCTWQQQCEVGQAKRVLGPRSPWELVAPCRQKESCCWWWRGWCWWGQNIFSRGPLWLSVALSVREREQASAGVRIQSEWCNAISRIVICLFSQKIHSNGKWEMCLLKQLYKRTRWSFMYELQGYINNFSESSHRLLFYAKAPKTTVFTYGCVSLLCTQQLRSVYFPSQICYLTSFRGSSGNREGQKGVCE